MEFDMEVRVEAEVTAYSEGVEAEPLVLLFQAAGFVVGGDIAEKEVGYERDAGDWPNCDILAGEARITL